MKDCTKCKYANWKRTKAGRLHPSGDGDCTYKFKIPEPPASMYFVYKPVVLGGEINRREELQRHCIYFQEKEE